MWRHKLRWLLTHLEMLQRVIKEVDVLVDDVDVDGVHSSMSEDEIADGCVPEVVLVHFGCAAVEGVEFCFIDRIAIEVAVAARKTWNNWHQRTSLLDKISVLPPPVRRVAWHVHTATPLTHSVSMRAHLIKLMLTRLFLRLFAGFVLYIYVSFFS